MDRPANQTPRAARAKRRCLWCLLWLAWMGLILGGFHLLTEYEIRPGLVAAPPQHYDESAAAASQQQPWTLIMFLHPHCACSRASVAELARVVEQATLPLDVRVWFFSPAGEADDWAQTALWRQAAAIPGVKLRVDLDGLEARRFDSATSGQTFLYSPKGKLVFTGGITASRGHFGTNPASERLAGILTGHEPAEPATADVFGCPLRDVERISTEGDVP